jgi:cytochrome c553
LSEAKPIIGLSAGTSRRGIPCSETNQRAAPFSPPVMGFSSLNPTGRRERLGDTMFRIRILVAAVAAGIATLACGGAAAGDAKAGRQKALQCQTCHGLDGVAKLPEAPNLAGQSEAYLIKALKDFRSGARRNDMMSLVTVSLKDADIADLAAYYAAIPVTVGTPPK